MVAKKPLRIYKSKMKKAVFLVFLALALAAGSFGQAPQPQKAFDLAAYGVTIEPDKRLIIVMAALEAAGFDPTPGKEPSLFRKQLREDLQNVSPDLKSRMKLFFDRNNKTYNRKTPAEQAAPYISLSYALTPAPELADPARTADLPSELLEVLDFSPLIREFYRRSGIDLKMPEYYRSYQAMGDEMRPSASGMVKDILGYLHTQPQLVYLDKITTEAKGKGKTKISKTEFRERERKFFIVPDLLSVSSTINFRNVGDDYYAVVPPNTDLENSEVRRAYLQFVVDPLVLRNGKDISPHRDSIRALIAERQKAGVEVSPDIFLAVMRSLVAAIDANEEEFYKIQLATYQARQKIDQAKDTEAKRAISAELARLKSEWADESALRLSEAYERGAVLAFYFAAQLKGIEDSGFDIASSFKDMLLSLDPSKENGRLPQFEDARKRALQARENRKKAAMQQNQGVAAVSEKEKAFLEKLNNSEEMIRLRQYENAEGSLEALEKDYPDDPRIFFAKGRIASLSAQDATDEEVRDERLGRAAAHYRNAVFKSGKSEQFKYLVSLAHVALGRILEFNEQFAAALGEYEAALKLGNIKGSGYQDAMAGKARLSKKP